MALLRERNGGSVTELPIPIDRAVWHANRTIGKGTCRWCGEFFVGHLNKWPTPPDSMEREYNPTSGKMERPFGLKSCQCGDWRGAIFASDCRIKKVHACDESAWLAYHLYVKHKKTTWNDVAELIAWPRSVDHMLTFVRWWAEIHHRPWPPA